MRKLLIPIFTWATCLLHAQDFAELEKELAAFGERSIMSITEEERLDKAELFAITLDTLLSKKGGIDLELESVKTLSIQSSDDDIVHFYTWVVPRKNGEYNHYGRLVIKGKDNVEVYPLEDESSQQIEPENVWGKTSNWYGAIYFDLREFKYKKDKYYLLFGYRPGNKMVQQKLLDVLTIDKSGAIRFGAKIFDTPLVFDKRYKKRPYRLIFEYNKKVTAMVKWSDNEKMIIMDHLTPPDASMKGMWQFYGPDFSYDGLSWEKGKFRLQAGIEVKSNVVPPVSTEKPKQGLGE